MFQKYLPRYAYGPTQSTSLLTETKVGGVTGISAGAGTLAFSVTYEYKTCLHNTHEIMGNLINIQLMQNYKIIKLRQRVVTQ